MIRQARKVKHMRVGTGVSSRSRIYTAAISATVTQLASITGNARSGSGNTTLPILIPTDMGQPSGASSCVQGINIRNTGSNTVFVMSSSTDAVAAGYPLYATEAVRIDVRDGMNTWVACAATFTSTIACWEV